MKALKFWAVFYLNKSHIFFFFFFLYLVAVPYSGLPDKVLVFSLIYYKHHKIHNSYSI